MTCLFDYDSQCFYDCEGCSRHKAFHEDMESGWYEVESEEDEDNA